MCKLSTLIRSFSIQFFKPNIVCNLEQMHSRHFNTFYLSIWLNNQMVFLSFNNLAFSNISFSQCQNGHFQSFNLRNLSWCFPLFQSMSQFSLVQLWFLFKYHDLHLSNGEFSAGVTPTSLSSPMAPIRDFSSIFWVYISISKCISTHHCCTSSFSKRGILELETLRRFLHFHF